MDDGRAVCPGRVKCSFFSRQPVDGLVPQLLRERGALRPNGFRDARGKNEDRLVGDPDFGGDDRARPVAQTSLIEALSISGRHHLPDARYRHFQDLLVIDFVELFMDFPAKTCRGQSSA
jgi:hypothetical protein